MWEEVEFGVEGDLGLEFVGILSFVGEVDGDCVFEDIFEDVVFRSGGVLR